VKFVQLADATCELYNIAMCVLSGRTSTLNLSQNAKNAISPAYGR
jgi:hypothetical protein